MSNLKKRKRLRLKVYLKREKRKRLRLKIHIKIKKRKKAEDILKNRENRDVFAIFLVSIVIIIISLIILVPSYFLISVLENETLVTYFMIFVQIFLAFLANTPWGLIPSILTSRFPKHFRFLAGSLTYNGGLVISFAAPFLLQQQVILNNQYDQAYYYVLFSMFLGGLSVAYGSWQILRNFLPKSILRNDNYGSFEIRLPSQHSQWGNYYYQYDDNKMEFKISRFKKNKWIMSIYFFKDKNYPKFLEDTIKDELRTKIMEKVKEEDEYNNVKINEIEGNEDEEEIFINSKIAKKKSFYIKNIREVFTSLIIPYSSNIYLILYRNNQDNSEDNNVISKIIDTFDIKIPLEKQSNDKETKTNV